MKLSLRIAKICETSVNKIIPLFSSCQTFGLPSDHVIDHGFPPKANYTYENTVAVRTFGEKGLGLPHNRCSVHE